MKFDSALNVPSSSTYNQLSATYMPVPCVEHPTHWTLLNFLLPHAYMHVHYVRYARM